MSENVLTIPDDIRALMESHASTEATREVDTSPAVISARGKKFRIGEEQLPEELTVVVGVAAFENAWYDRPYDPDNTTVPACFAIGTDDDEQRHHEDSPVPQHDGECKDCTLNQWDTGPNGKGKACKNARRLVLLAHDSDTPASQAQMALLKVPPTSMKNWASYSKSITLRYKRPTFGVLTKISFDSAFDYPRLRFDLVGLIEDGAELKAIMNRQEEMTAFATRPFNVTDFEPMVEDKRAKNKRSKMS